MADLNRREAIATALSLAVLPAAALADEKPKEKPAPVIPENALVVIVTDPLSKELSCPCVNGYGQRDYDKLGKYLEGKVGCAVAVVYGESLAGALKKSGGKAHLVVGKDSVVRATAPASKVEGSKFHVLEKKTEK